MSYINGNAPRLTTTIPLLAGEVWTSEIVSILQHNSLDVIMISDVTGSLDVEYSGDGINFELVETHAYTTAGQGYYVSVPIRTKYLRYVYTNGGVDQTYFRLYSYTSYF